MSLEASASNIGGLVAQNVTAGGKTSPSSAKRMAPSPIRPGRAQPLRTASTRVRTS
jgi:hypothetical protein